MVKVIEGKTKSSAKKYGIVVSRFNEFITRRLLDGCVDELKKCGVKQSEMTIAWVPGALELPVTALKMAKKKNIHGVICLGAVIRGETFHFELVCQGAASGISQVSLMTGKPVIFGVISTDTVNQAYERSELKGDNKGRYSALAAVEMVNVLKKV